MSMSFLSHTMQAAPSVPPGFEPLHTAQFVGPTGGGQSASHHPNEWRMIELVAQACDKLQKEVEQLKKQNRLQGGLINWLKEDVRCYEQSKTTISNLEGNLAQLASQVQAIENSRGDEILQVASLKEENRKLMGVVGDLRRELGRARRVVMGVCVGGAIVGGIVIVAGVLARVK